MEKNIDILSNLIITNKKLSLKNVVDFEDNEGKKDKDDENDENTQNIKRNNDNKYKTTKFLNFNPELLKRKNKMNTTTLKLVNPVAISDLTENNKYQEKLDNITRKREKENSWKKNKENNNDAIKEILDENNEDKDEYENEDNDFDSIITDENVEKICLKNKEFNIKKRSINKIGLVIRNTKKQLTKKLISANLENSKKLIDDVMSIKLTSNLSNTYKMTSDKIKNIFDTDQLINNHITLETKDTTGKSFFFNFSPEKKRKNTTKSQFENNDEEDEFNNNDIINYENEIIENHNKEEKCINLIPFTDCLNKNDSEFNSIKDSNKLINDKSNNELFEVNNANNKVIATPRKNSNISDKSKKSKYTNKSQKSQKSPKKNTEKEMNDFQIIATLDRDTEVLILDNLLQQYYYDIKFNIPGNYEEYVVNSITIISVLEKLIIKNNVKSPQLSEEQLLQLKKLDLNKKTLVIDLDETLIHSDINNEYDCAETIISININGENSSFGLIVRPFTNEFLQFASERFNLIIFTAGVKDYADPIIDYLDPNDIFFSLRLYRDSCTQYENFFIKDLSILNLPIEHCIILDNCIFSFTKDVQSGILISTFHDNMEDKDLLNVADYLDDNILNSDDVRATNESFYGFESIKKMMYNKLIEEGCISIK